MPYNTDSNFRYSNNDKHEKIEMEQCDTKRETYIQNSVEKQKQKNLCFLMHLPHRYKLT